MRAASLELRREAGLALASLSWRAEERRERAKSFISLEVANTAGVELRLPLRGLLGPLASAALPKGAWQLWWLIGTPVVGSRMRSVRSSNIATFDLRVAMRPHMWSLFVCASLLPTLQTLGIRERPSYGEPAPLGRLTRAGDDSP